MSFFQTLAAAFKGERARVPLARSFTSPWYFADEPAYDYASAVKRAYLDNPVAQRAVRLVAEGIGGAPLLPVDPALAALVGATSAGQALLETLASHLLLNGIPRRGSTVSESSRRPWSRSDDPRRCPRAMRCGLVHCRTSTGSCAPAVSPKPRA